MPGPAQVPNSAAPPPASSEGAALRRGSLAEPELQAARDSAHSFEVLRPTSCVPVIAHCRSGSLAGGVHPVQLYCQLD